MTAYKKYLHWSLFTWRCRPNVFFFNSAWNVNCIIYFRPNEVENVRKTITLMQSCFVKEHNYAIEFSSGMLEGFAEGQPLIVKRLNSLQFSRPPPKRNIF